MARIHPLASVDGSAQIADDAEIGPFCTIGPNVRVGAHCRLVAHVHVEGHTTIGDRTLIYPHASLGTPPQSTHYRGGPTELIIGSDCEIRENVTMNTGTEDGHAVTRVGHHSTFMAGAHVAHDCTVGNNVVFANAASLAGHCAVEDGVMMAAFSGAHQYTRIGEGAMIGGFTGLRGDVIPFGLAVGDTARLVGLNAVGLRRRGVTATTLGALRRVYRKLFNSPEPLEERLAAIDAEFGDLPYALQITAFVRARDKRPLCRPGRSAAGERNERS